MKNDCQKNTQSSKKQKGVEFSRELGANKENSQNAKKSNSDCKR